MRTVQFISVLWGAARLLGLDPQRDLTNPQAARYTEYLNRHVAKAWRFERWPEWTVTEQRWFRPWWDEAVTYAAQAEVYYPPADKYYQALTASTGQAPALLQADGTYAVNALAWAECLRCYQGADFNPAATYALGDVVRNPANRHYYQLYGRTFANQQVNLFATLVASLAGPGKIVAVRGVYQVTAAVASQPSVGANDVDLNGVDGVAVTGALAANSDWPWLVIVIAVNNGDEISDYIFNATQIPAAAASAVLTDDGFSFGTACPAISDLSAWGLLTPFNRYIAYEQPGMTKIWEAPNPCAFKRDPRVFPHNPWPVCTSRNDLGITFPPEAPNSVWLMFWPPPPCFTSTVYSATENIAVGTVRYYPATGECYRALQAQTPATQPPTNAAFWQKIDFPFVLSAYVTRAAQSDALRDQKQNDRATAELDMALEDLQDEADKALLGQGIVESATVMV